MAPMKKVMKKMSTLIRCYSELILLPTFDERYDYLKLDGSIGKETFGVNRWLNQVFYHTDEWKRIRRDVINRDFGRDLGVLGYDIFGYIYVHHMNPITKNDIDSRSRYLLDPEFMICCRKRTHDMIHYGNEKDTVYQPVIERTPGDTCLWKRRIT